MRYSKAVKSFLKYILQSPGESKSRFLLRRVALNGTIKSKIKGWRGSSTGKSTYEDKDLSSGPRTHVTTARHGCVDFISALLWVGRGGSMELTG